MSTKCETLSHYGLYGCKKNELEDVIKDFDDCNELFVLSVKTDSGMTLYSHPASVTKIRSEMDDLVDSMRNEEVIKLGINWVNTRYIITVRICKYIPRKEVEYYE